MGHQLLILCFSVHLYVASALSSDGLTLLSLLNHWTFVPPSINLSWNASDSTPCSWVGVKCNHDSQVISLNLTASGVTGKLGPEIGNLNHLQTIVLLTNNLSGVIPPELGNCSLLRYIEVSDNYFSGQIPYTLKKLQNLQYLSLSYNMLTGEIPESLFQIPQLEEVYLYNNGVSGPIPTNIGNMSELSKLYLSSNQLSGNIPSSIGNCSKLQDLELYFNHLQGEIPLGIWKVQSLQHILVHNNSLSGTLPLEVTELKHLKNISLFDNQFSGVIPQSLGINSSLVKLDLMNNEFTGNIPPNLCFGKQLRVLNLGLNQLQGGIPHDVGRCATLSRLTLNENNFTGSLPEFESNQNLMYMDISKNNISGAIPSSLGNCTNLTALILSKNIITGLIPSELGNLVNLQFLNLAHNKLEGPLPQLLSYCTKMEWFDVGFNFLNGSLPSSLRNWTEITTLILRENRFSGVIPSFLSEFNLLLDLQLGGNLFGGKIPASIGAMQNLLYGLNLSANGFAGEVPLEIGKLKKLQVLDVSLNNLTGSIDVLGELSSLIEVNISYNSFVGPVPERLLQYLNFSASSFMGNPGLCVHCYGLSCSKPRPSYLKPCDATDHKGISKSVILVIELGSSTLVALFLVKLIHLRLSRQRSEEIMIVYRKDEGQFHPKKKEEGQFHPKKKEEGQFHRKRKEKEEGQWFGEVMKATENLGDRYIVARRVDGIVYKAEPTFGEVMKATENLDDRYIVGRGAHGIVYKAELDHFRVFAVKKLVFAGNKRKISRMRREIEIMKNLRHRYVARFRGSWIGNEHGLIFLRYFENGSLHDVLHGNDAPPLLEWTVRYKIAVGVAKGLAYLHHVCDPPILHRDINPKNILLDSDMEPCIIDFGIAIALGQSSAGMRLRSTYHIGTLGFMAPEIAYAVVPSCELDVYSYGVVLLELITRKKVLDSSFEVEETTLVLWFRSVWREAKEIEEIADSSLARELSDLNVMVQVIKVLLVALMCTEKDPRKRPKMRDVIKIFAAPTIEGIYVQRGTFHLGRALAASARSIYMQPDRAIIIKGFPQDVKQRELSNLLRWLPGYEASKLSFMSGRPKGYAFFNTTQQAVAAIYILQDLLFDARTKSVLHAEMADKHYVVEGGPRDEDYLLIGCASTSASSSSRYHSHGVWGINMASPPTPNIPYTCLHDVLHVENLQWNVRYKIAVGIAHELAYLHHDCDPPIVPQDLNPKNIFLDPDMETHICQFGVSMPMNPSSSPTGEPSAIVPVNAGTLTENGHRMVEAAVASDVRDYGVVLLELLTKNKLFDSYRWKKTIFLERVRFVWRETGNLEQVVDSSLARELSDSTVVVQVTKMLSVALLCIEKDLHKRPTMKTVIKLL